MNSLRKLQKNFLDHLLDNTDHSVIRRIESTPQATAEQRMSFYANAYYLRLKEALGSDYERLHMYLGDDLFDTLVRHYIERFPSQYTSLRDYGQHMPVLVEQLEPFNSLIEVSEIVRIEQAFANSFDASDYHPVTLEQLIQLPSENWAGLTIKFHSAVQVLPQTCNSFQIWRALTNEEIPPKIVPDNTCWLIWRQKLISHYRALDYAELSALTVAISTGSFAEICEVLLTHFSEQDTPLKAVEYLQQWIHDEMICELN